MQLGREMHIWLGEPVGGVGEARVNEFAQTLSVSERARAERHSRTGRYQRTVLSRFMLRDILSRYVPATPAHAWQFETGSHGKPAVVGPVSAPCFNVSHTCDRIVMLVADSPGGVDIEAWDREGRLNDVADRFFAPSESAAVRGLQTGAARRRFLETWTLKEAFVKALGRGLSFKLLKQFWFDFDTPLAAIAPGTDVPATWQFWHLEPDPGYLLGAAIPDAGPRQLKLWRYRFGAEPRAGEPRVTRSFSLPA